MSMKLVSSVSDVGNRVLSGTIFLKKDIPYMYCTGGRGSTMICLQNGNHYSNWPMKKSPTVQDITDYLNEPDSELLERGIFDYERPKGLLL